MMPFSFIGSGSYLSNGVNSSIVLSDKPDFFRVTDIELWGTATTAIAQMQSWIYPRTMPAGSYLQTSQISAAVGSNFMYGSQGTTNGFTFIDPAHPTTFGSLAYTAINTTTFVITMGNTGSIAVGDWIRLINPIGLLQLSGLEAQVTAVTPNVSITLGRVATAVTAGAFFAPTVGTGFVKKIIQTQFNPYKLQVLHITKAIQPTVYFAGQNVFIPGSVVDFNIPKSYGMTEASFLTGKSRGPANVLTQSGVSQILIDVDTSGFNPFAYPTSAGSVGVASPPICVPAGSGIVYAGPDFINASRPARTALAPFDNLSQYSMSIGSSVVGISGSTMQWEAWKADYSVLSNA